MLGSPANPANSRSDRSGRLRTPLGSAKRDRTWIMFLDPTIAATFAFATAALGFLLAGTWGVGGLYGWLTAVSLFLLAGAAACRARILARRANSGTLYYVRMLDAGMTDTHQEDLDAIRQDHEDVRAVTAWIPPHTASIPAKGGRMAGIDVTGEVWGVAQNLQLAMNTDTNDTSFAIAPNLLWPMAVSIGYQAYLFDNTWLVEADQGERWAVHPTPKSTDTWLTQRHVGGVGSPSASTLALLLDLTGPVTIPKQWSALPFVRVEGATGKTAVTLGTSTVRRATPSGWENKLLDGWIATRDCSAAIVHALLENPNAYILLAARVPKSVAFGLGWRLGQKLDVPTGRLQDPQGRPKPPYFNPWERLITVQLDPPVQTVTRVHPSQPDLETMIEIASTGSRRQPLRRRPRHLRRAEANRR